MLTFSPCACAQTIALPLEGYFRPGAYFPVVIDTLATATIIADAAMPTRCPPMHGVAPVFAFSATADHVTCGDQSLPLRALGEGDRLVGCAARDDAVIETLFPGHQLVRVDLTVNLTDPLPGPPVAWAALDALVVDAIDPRRIDPLLANGTTLVVRTEVKPDAVWPWRRVLDAWVLLPPHATPARADRVTRAQAAYQSAELWQTGLAPAARALVVLVGVLCACAMLAISMWRSRWTLAALTGFSVVLCVGLILWRKGQPDVSTAVRSLIVPSLPQTDVQSGVLLTERWRYQTSPVATDVTLACDANTLPLFASPSHAAAMRATLECDSNGELQTIRYHLPADGKMAFVSTGVEPAK